MTKHKTSHRDPATDELMRKVVTPGTQQHLKLFALTRILEDRLGLERDQTGTFFIDPYDQKRYNVSITVTEAP